MNLVERYGDYFNKLTQTFMEAFLKEEQGKNIVFSPYSILMLLGIAAQATDKATRAELLQVVAPQMDMEQAEKLLLELNKNMSAQATLITSNAVCVKADYEKTLRTDYAGKLSSIFEGELIACNDMVADVNAWVKEHTAGMIDRIVDDSAAAMLVCLLNAIAFKAEWSEPYEEDDIFENDFFNADGTTREVNYLYSFEETLVQNEFFKGFIKEYQNDEFSFMALLPKKEGASYLSCAIKSLDFSKLFKSAEDAFVRVNMPEFICDYRKNLTTLCQGLGICELFTSAADFSNMSSAKLMVDAILHRAHVEVDRNGTKAAAVSASSFVGCGMMFERPFEEICLNRPFVYAIMNNKTGLPVFAGVVNQL